MIGTPPSQNPTTADCVTDQLVSEKRRLSLLLEVSVSVLLQISMCFYCDCQFMGQRKFLLASYILYAESVSWVQNFKCSIISGSLSIFSAGCWSFLQWNRLLEMAVAGRRCFTFSLLSLSSPPHSPPRSPPPHSHTVCITVHPQRVCSSNSGRVPGPVCPVWLGQPLSSRRHPGAREMCSVGCHHHQMAGEPKLKPLLRMYILYLIAAIAGWENICKIT